MASSAKDIEFSFESDAWKDITPIEIDPEDEAAVIILFSEEFKEIMAYFRAILANHERSERALWLTEKVIEHNAANYTAWYFRRQCLSYLNADLHTELDFVTSKAEEHPKNYQIWFHRRAIVEMLGDPSRELEFTKEVLQEDSKNYHAWSHRQWVIRTYNIWDGELSYIDELLKEDLRNNSAWNQRYFVIENTKLKPNKSDPLLISSIIEEEIKYALSYIDKAPSNESPYNYITGLMRNKKYRDYPFLQKHAEDLFAKQLVDETVRISTHLLGLLVELYSEDETTATKACKLCDDLANKYDRIRQKYWLYRKRRITSNP